MFLCFTQLGRTHSITAFVSGRISEDKTFLHKTFPVPPSTRAIIEVDVYDPVGSLRQRGHYVMMGIYTTLDHVNFRKQCTETMYGQFENQHLHLGITKNTGLSGRLRCNEDSFNALHCMGNITIQDFIPRKFSFSFGFHCNKVHASDSLRGLFYNISFYGTNKTDCFEMPSNDTCYRYLQYEALLNLEGNEYTANHGGWSIDRSDIMDYLRYNLNCYQHLHEYLCYEIVPKCDPVLDKVIPPCREMCHEVFYACFLHTLPPTFPWANCDYLPSIRGNITCFYDPVFCMAPPIVKNSTVKTNNTERGYFLNDTVEYSCDEGYEIVGNKSISYTYSGQWSTPPKCLWRPGIKSALNPLQVVLPILIIMLFFSGIIICSQMQNEIKKETKI